MLRSRTVPATAALVAAAALALTGCSSSGSGGGTPPSRATLTSVVLKTSDIPSGYKGTPFKADSGDNTDIITQLQSCVGVSGIKNSDKLRQVHSEDFTKGQFTISSDATAFKSQSAVDSRVKVLKSPKINSCLNTTFDAELSRSLPSSASAANTDIKIKQGSDGGPSDIIATGAGNLIIQANGQSAPAYFAVSFVRNGLLTASVSYFSLGATIDDSLRHKLDRAVANRVANT